MMLKVAASFPQPVLEACYKAASEIYADLSKTKVAGDYELAGNQLMLAAVLPPLEDAGGKISFTESSFALREARGRIFGGEVSVSGGSRPRNCSHKAARARL